MAVKKGIRKTKKYYQEKIEKSYDDAYEVLPEILHKYGSHFKGAHTYRMKCNAPESFWNNYIEEFVLTPKKELKIIVYYQGAYTDGVTWAILEKNGVKIPAEYSEYEKGVKTEVHSNISISPEDIYLCIKSLVNLYLK